MKILSYAIDGQTRLGALLSGERVLDLTNVYPTALAFLEAGEIGMSTVLSAVARAEAGESLAGQVRPLEAVQLKAPVPQARKLLALAGNYQEHVREGGRPTHAKEETYPYFFMKPASTALIGSGEAVKLPGIGQRMDYEGEFVIVIGRRGKQIPVDHAYRYVAGYTILNDISERKLASKEPPRVERERDKFFDWLVGKWFDTSAPCGPWLVTRDEIEDPHDLQLRTRVNGEVRQDSSTREMIFTVPEIIAFISRVLTLEPGDLIATGTPGGVGSARGVFLQPEDTVEVEIERIGLLRNSLVAE
ncbi:MAG: fumarylacetoacetate hydrolase family protein [Armatimonadetes bacterium]|jgi:2-keto-4-pentenoate hydratase/2-oxohepta-3-ene-1,7-dioic acid hydratase in catechol pathway|nr:fumarylacetoacetate hydrolase family protein [Armatimonadota bacterium]